MAVVVFDVEKFRKVYPGFGDEVKYSDVFLEDCFDSAVLLIGNTDKTSFAPYQPELKIFEREKLLYLATCHLASLMSDPAGNTGRVQSASQGSVSVGYDLIKTNSARSDWWNMTRCGALFWILASKYLTGGRFIAGERYHPWG